MADTTPAKSPRRFNWRSMLSNKPTTSPPSHRSSSASDLDNQSNSPEKSSSAPNKWTLGILSDPKTDEVPGSILLLSKVSEYNEPLGLRNAPARTSASSLPYAPSPGSSRSRARQQERERKRTADGKIVLEPQPTESANDPLNWPVLRRDLALLSLGFYCMVGGGMTPVLAAGFSQVSADLDVSVPQVALTTGLYMMGLGLGSVVLSPTAILYGKRPVYLVAGACFAISGIWCALSPNFASLVVARIFMGFAVSSVECLPSATIAEIYFLHEKAYRLGIYTLLLLGGKNLVPLVSAAIIQSLGWRWVFWIVAIVVGAATILLFLFVPETFWDRAPVPHRQVKKKSFTNLHIFNRTPTDVVVGEEKKHGKTIAERRAETIAERRAESRHARFAEDEGQDGDVDEKSEGDAVERVHAPVRTDDDDEAHQQQKDIAAPTTSATETKAEPEQHAFSQKPSIPQGTAVADYFAPNPPTTTTHSDQASAHSPFSPRSPDIEHQHPNGLPSPGGNPYTKALHHQPAKTFRQQLRPYSGRLQTNDKWIRVMLRPFILFAYPSILWSSLIYALSIGWLIVISESVSSIYENRESYSFSALQVGLVYISPFIGGVLGTAVAGKVSDLIVRFLARKNGGVYEPEFRLVMAIPIAITTVIGLMGFGWSAEEKDNWIVPTVFFGIISFGCSLGSTTSITFAVDSYRQYAGEALVTLNFSKNILHGLVWSLFFNRWLEADGSKKVFVAIGGIQLACLLTTVPMYVWGKRARMWTVRRNMMEKF